MAGFSRGIRKPLGDPKVEFFHRSASKYKKESICKERILHNYRCIFIHIPKTAGNSITYALNFLPKITDKDYSSAKIGKHAKAVEVKRILGDKIWEEYFTFSFVRNPWDLVVSCYYWWLQKAHKWEKFHPDIRRIQQLGSFDGFMHSQYGREMINEIKGNIFDWISEEGEIIVDFVGRFENIQEDWKEVCEHIGAQDQTLPHKNRTERKPYRGFYTNETREIVAERFWRSIEEFGYSF